MGGRTRVAFMIFFLSSLGTCAMDCASTCFLEYRACLKTSDLAECQEELGQCLWGCAVTSVDSGQDDEVLAEEEEAGQGEGWPPGWRKQDPDSAKYLSDSQISLQGSSYSDGSGPDTEERSSEEEQSAAALSSSSDRTVEIDQKPLQAEKRQSRCIRQAGEVINTPPLAYRAPEKDQPISMTKRGSWFKREPIKVEERGSWCKRDPIKIEKKGSWFKREPIKVEERGSWFKREPIKIEERGSWFKREPIKIEERGSWFKREPIKIEERGSWFKREPIKIEKRGSWSKRQPMNIEERGSWNKRGSWVLGNRRLLNVLKRGSWNKRGSGSKRLLNILKRGSWN